jgi:hypothetical protein
MPRRSAASVRLTVSVMLVIAAVLVVELVEQRSDPAGHATHHLVEGLCQISCPLACAAKSSRSSSVMTAPTSASGTAQGPVGGQAHAVGDLATGEGLLGVGEHLQHPPVRTGAEVGQPAAQLHGRNAPVGNGDDRRPRGRPGPQPATTPAPSLWTSPPAPDAPPPAGRRPDALMTVPTRAHPRCPTPPSAGSDRTRWSTAGRARASRRAGSCGQEPPCSSPHGPVPTAGRTAWRWCPERHAGRVARSHRAHGAGDAGLTTSSGALNVAGSKTTSPDSSGVSPTPPPAPARGECAEAAAWRPRRACIRQRSGAAATSSRRPTPAST